MNAIRRFVGAALEAVGREAHRGPLGCVIHELSPPQRPARRPARVTVARTDEDERRVING